MNKLTSQIQSPAEKRLYARAFASTPSRQHLQPMYTSVWLALLNSLLNSRNNAINSNS